MNLQIVEEPTDDTTILEAYGSIPIAFMVVSRFVVTPIEQGLSGLQLAEEPVDPPYLKDYDAIEGERPIDWPRVFDLTHWGILAAYDGQQRIGGAVMAWKTADLEMLEERDDLAVLWDLRVAPAYRARGIGHRLFNAVSAWAQARGCRELKVETQNINVGACHFYARQGCQLRTIHQNAYPGLPGEVQLLWYKTLTLE